MVVRRVKSLRRVWVLAAALGSVFFGGCVGNADVDRPLRYRNAWDVPVNITLELGEEVYGLMNQAVAEAVKEAVPQLSQNELDELSGIIMGADTLINDIMRSNGDYYNLLLDFMKSDTAMKALLEENGLKADSVANDIANDIKQNDFIKEISNPASSVIISLGLSESLPALDGMDFLSDVSDRKLSWHLDIFNGAPFSFKIYALFFDEQYRELVDGKDSSQFISFIKNGGYKDAQYAGGFINFFENGSQRWLTMNKGLNTNVSKPSPETQALLLDFIDGEKPLAWRWIAELGNIGSEGNLIKSDGIKVMLSISVSGTVTF